MSSDRAVFLDRDGVINDVVLRDGRPFPPPSLAELRLLEGVKETIRGLKAAGLSVVVVTNQPDVRTGLQSRDVVEAIHAHLRSELEIDAIEVCFHVDADGCSCRKPAPGMLLQAAERAGLDLAKSFLVGDRWRDIEAGERAGCSTFWIRNDYAERKPERPDFVVRSLAEAGERILEQLGRET